MWLSYVQSERQVSKEKKPCYFKSKYLRNEGTTESGIMLHVKDAFQILIWTSYGQQDWMKWQRERQLNAKETVSY